MSSIKNERKNKKGKNTETTTITLKKQNDSITMNESKEFSNYELYKKVFELETKSKELETQVKNINNNIGSIRKKENRLLNRFGWTLIMANVFLGVLCGIVILGYFQFVYPILQKNINSEGVFELIKYISFAIIGGLVTTWFSVLKFAKYIKDRDQKSVDINNN